MYLFDTLKWLVVGEGKHIVESRTEYICDFRVEYIKTDTGFYKIGVFLDGGGILFAAGGMSAQQAADWFALKIERYTGYETTTFTDKCALITAHNWFSDFAGIPRAPIEKFDMSSYGLEW